MIGPSDEAMRHRAKAAAWIAESDTASHGASWSRGSYFSEELPLSWPFPVLPLEPEPPSSSLGAAVAVGDGVGVAVGAGDAVGVVGSGVDAGSAVGPAGTPPAWPLCFPRFAVWWSLFEWMSEDEPPDAASARRGGAVACQHCGGA